MSDIKSRREAAGYTTLAFSELACVSTKVLNRAEKGESVSAFAMQCIQTGLERAAKAPQRKRPPAKTPAPDPLASAPVSELRARRQALGLTQEALGKLSYVATTSVVECEAGKSESPNTRPRILRGLEKAEASRNLTQIT